MAENLSHCAGEVKKHDRDRFLCALFARLDAREGLFAIYAFNHEIARIAEAVREPLAGEIRLQWWRDAMAGVYAGDPPRHPVAVALSETVRRFALSRSYFDRLLDARGTELAGDPPADADALICYAKGISAPVSWLGLEVLGVGGDAAFEAARHVGIAWAITGLVRAIPFHAARARVYLPAVSRRHGALDVDALLRGPPVPGLADVVSELCELAAGHLADARRLRAQVPRAALPVLLPATLAEGYLGKLRSVRHEPFAAHVRASAPSRLVLLALNAFWGRY
jgi:NADH dehydrogenase [ubiquinone] 1 alpha subcomplex assembly factor 6